MIPKSNFTSTKNMSLFTLSRKLHYTSNSSIPPEQDPAAIFLSTGSSTNFKKKVHYPLDPLTKCQTRIQESINILDLGPADPGSQIFLGSRHMSATLLMTKGLPRNETCSHLVTDSILDLTTTTATDLALTYATDLTLTSAADLTLTSATDLTLTYATDLNLTYATDLTLASAADLTLTSATNLALTSAADLTLTSATNLALTTAADLALTSAADLTLTSATDLTLTSATDLSSSVKTGGPLCWVTSASL